MARASMLSPVEEVAEFFARGPSPEEIARFQLSEAAQQRIAGLLDKEDDGELTGDEQRLLDELMLLDELVALIRSRIPLPPAAADSAAGGPTGGARG